MSISAPIIYNNIKIDKSDEETYLPRDYEDYFTLYLYTGRTDFYGASIAFNSDDILFQVWVDGALLTEDNIDNLKWYNRNINTIGVTPAFFSWNSNDKILHFNPPYPIQIRESIEIKVKANRNSNSRKVEGYRIALTKEVA